MPIARPLAFLALATAAACGPMRKSGPSLPPAHIIFSNQALDQADVFAYSSSGARTRIGTVMAGRTDTLRVTQNATGGSGTVTIVARVLARGFAPSSGQVTLLPGDWLAITMPPDERILTVLPVREP